MLFFSFFVLVDAARAKKKRVRFLKRNIHTNEEKEIKSHLSQALLLGLLLYDNGFTFRQKVVSFSVNNVEEKKKRQKGWKYFLVRGKEKKQEGGELIDVGSLTVQMW